MSDDPSTPPSSPPAPAMVRDIFGRPLERHGPVLGDWEGQLANLAIPFDLVPPPRQERVGWVRRQSEKTKA